MSLQMCKGCPGLLIHAFISQRGDGGSEAGRTTEYPQSEARGARNQGIPPIRAVRGLGM